MLIFLFLGAFLIGPAYPRFLEGKEIKNAINNSTLKKQWHAIILLLKDAKLFKSYLSS